MPARLSAACCRWCAAPLCSRLLAAHLHCCQVVTDPAAVATFEKRLRRYCADAGAEFIAYKPDGGVWRFRVRNSAGCCRCCVTHTSNITVFASF